MQRNSFVIYTKYAEPLSELSNKQKEILFQSIMNHEAGIDEKIEIELATKKLFELMIEDIDTYVEK